MVTGMLRPGTRGDSAQRIRLPFGSCIPCGREGGSSGYKGEPIFTKSVLRTNTRGTVCVQEGFPSGIFLIGPLSARVIMDSKGSHGPPFMLESSIVQEVWVAISLRTDVWNRWDCRCIGVFS